MKESNFQMGVTAHNPPPFYFISLHHRDVSAKTKTLKGKVGSASCFPNAASEFLKRYELGGQSSVSTPYPSTSHVVDFALFFFFCS